MLCYQLLGGAGIVQRGESFLYALLVSARASRVLIMYLFVDALLY